MNVKRGLFRLWLVGAVLFVLAVAAISFEDIKSQFQVWSLQRHLDENRG
jgi:hypothetical protein